LVTAGVLAAKVEMHKESEAEGHADSGSKSDVTRNESMHN
jgi:hypothetical protein